MISMFGISTTPANASGHLALANFMPLILPQDTVSGPAYLTSVLYLPFFRTASLSIRPTRMASVATTSSERAVTRISTHCSQGVRNMTFTVTAT